MLNAVKSRGTLFNAGLIFVFAVVIICNVFGIVKLQASINQNQAQTETFRQQNTDRQKDLKKYIKCIVLIRFDHPEIVSQTATKAQVSKALDECVINKAEN